jgi:hypothetical protein
MPAEDETPDWSRGEAARWWLEHDEPGKAAAELEPGDDLVVSDADFPELAKALTKRGLAAIHDEERAYIYTAEEALKMIEQLMLDGIVVSERRPPGRTPGPPLEKARRRKSA